MIIWGISANSHDAALTVYYNNKIAFASHSERFSGVKNDPHLHQDLLDYALDWGYPERVIWYERPILKTVRQLVAGQGFLLDRNNIHLYLKSYGITAPITFIDHHLSHAAAGYFTSNFDHASILVMDAIGEFNTLTLWEADKEKLTKKYTSNYPNSIGLWYSAMTQRLGLKPNEDEYILMGMAAYGDSNKYTQEILDTFFKISYTSSGFPKIKSKHNLHRGCLWWKSEQQHSINNIFTQWAYDVAASVQAIYIKLLNLLSNYIYRNFTSSNLVFMGGCALNCTANTTLVNTWKDPKNIWIMPNPGDAGSSLGSILAYTQKHLTWPGPYLGYNIKGENPVDETIKELLSTGIVGVASGKAEFGPRAFGNRSLLADPRNVSCKDKVNTIKRRQKFRPFAPAILEEYANEFFDSPFGYYMQYTTRCKYPEQYPAIIHADGTSRVQTVAKTDKTGFRLLLERWYEITGCPMLLNTSLNIRGKPMINDLTDAQEFSTLYNVKVFS